MLVKDGAAEVDVGRYMARTSLELISRAIIGHSFDPLTEAYYHSYAVALKTIMCVSELLFYDHVWALTVGLLES